MYVHKCRGLRRHANSSDHNTPYGAAAGAALSNTIEVLERADARGQTSELLDLYRTRRAFASQYVEAYRRYRWDVGSINDLKVAPFHLLASEGVNHTDRDHVWHTMILARLCAADQDVLMTTAHRIVNLNDLASEQGAMSWWEEHTGRGGEVWSLSRSTSLLEVDAAS